MTEWKGKGWLRLWAILLTGVVIAASLSGCGVHETPDGFRFRSGNTEQSVRDQLGPPDLISERWSYGVDRVRTLYYLDRSYGVTFRNASLRGVVLFGDDKAQLTDMRRRSVAFKAVVPLVRIGGTGQEVLDQLGPPDYIHASRLEGRLSILQYSGPHQNQLQQNPAPDEAVCEWKRHDVFVKFEGGKVLNVVPMYQSMWKRDFHQEPPGNSARMDSAIKADQPQP